MRDAFKFSEGGKRIGLEFFPENLRVAYAPKTVFVVVMKERRNQGSIDGRCDVPIPVVEFGVVSCFQCGFIGFNEFAPEFVRPVLEACLQEEFRYRFTKSDNVLVS